MKKNGFTLAEVLITLAIIGVVATMTLPALLTNTAEQQAKTALKKGINTLTEAAQMNQAIAGFDYASLTETSQALSAQSLYALLANRTAVDYRKSGTSMLVSQQGSATSDPSANMAVFFRDGSALLYPVDTVTTATAAVMEDDGLVHGISVIYDTNGSKGPNIVSNCQGKALGVANDKAATDKTIDDQCTPATRVIKDQFGVRLRNGYAVPNGAAAQWAFEN